MSDLFSAPQLQRDELLGVLVGLARSTFSEPKTEDTDRVLSAGLRLAADPAASEAALQRMTAIAAAEKLRVAPNCATCAMPCGNTNNYDLARLWNAPEKIRSLKVRLLSALFAALPDRKRPNKSGRRSVTVYLFSQRTGMSICCSRPYNGPKRFASGNFFSNKDAFSGLKANLFSKKLFTNEP